MVDAKMRFPKVTILADFEKVLCEAKLLVKKESKNAEKETNAINITDITFDSRNISPGALFICKGSSFKEEYLRQAIAAGAVAYLSQKPYDVEIPGLIVSNVRRAMALVARDFFDYPDRKLHLIGVTATKGKTTTVFMIKSVFDAALRAQGEKPCGLLSGIENFDGKSTREAHLTTEESVELFRNLAQCVENGLSYCVVEISSQALKYDRVAEIEFDTCSFINIGTDHISPVEHPDFADYFASKLKITERTKDFIYCAQMDFVEQVLQKAEQEGVKTHSFSVFGTNDEAENLRKIGESGAEFKVTDVITGSDGSRFKVNGNEYAISMPGAFNIENAVVAVICGLLADFDSKDIAIGLSEVRVPGRSELTSTLDKKIHFFVDYAHNEISFESALRALRELFPKAKIFTLFGAPGNKAFNRRKDLPQVAAKYSTKIFIIPEDTANEPVAQISAEVVSHVPNDIPYQIINDRAEGISVAFAEAEKNLQADPNLEFVLFVAGKGQELFMKEADGYAPYIGDHRVAQSLLEAYDKNLQ